jgi:hypothetical protein
MLAEIWSKLIERGKEWPPCSPDLNLIEYVWSWMVQKVRKGGWPTTVKALKRKVKAVWNSLNQESFQNLVRRYRKMLEAVCDAKGDRVPYLLNQAKTQLEL